MNVILHIGQHKTGTTALQRFLHFNSDILRKHGVLYPQDDYHPNDHSFLYPLIYKDQPLPRYETFRFRGNRRKAEELAVVTWNRLLDEVSAMKPRTLVLSTEYLFNPLSEDSKSRLGELLGKLSARVQVCVYIREPAAEYLSRVQQILKYSSRYPEPRPRPCQEILESYVDVPGASVTAVAFDRTMLEGGDIKTDFLSRFLPSGTELQITSGPSVDNVSMSAEAMALNQEYRARRFPEKDEVVIDDHLVYLDLLEQLDQSVPEFVRPRLKPHVRDLIRVRALEFVWLRDEHGIFFPDLDYDTVGQDAADIATEFRKVEDICEVDAARLAELRQRIENEMARPSVAIKKLKRRARALISALMSARRAG